MDKNVIVGQSGGPTAAINASLAGVYTAARAAGAPRVLGMRYGAEGLLRGELVDLDQALAAPDALELLRRTPSSFLGSCRYKLPDPAQDEAPYRTILARLEENNVGAFFYIGGNDSMDTIAKLSRYGAAVGSPIRFVGVPKTIDNDLCLTDHTPGYGSAAKYIAASLSEVLCDATVYNIPSVTVVEIMGRNAGWLAGAACLADDGTGRGPDLILLPEADFDEAAFLARLKELLAVKPGLVVAISEGIHTADGVLLCEQAPGGAQQDAFGHRAFLSGAGGLLAGLIHEKLGCKARAVELSLLQRCASHLASAADLAEAEAAGRAAVKAADAGDTGVMIAFARAMQDGAYRCDTVAVPVSRVANEVRAVPREWITPDGMQVTQQFRDYALPLIQGEVDAVWKNGVPQHISL